MNILITSSRMPFALDLIRKLGRAGHRVIAADTFSTAPGSHSKFAADWKLISSPRYETADFIDDLIRIIDEESIDAYIPAFEEAFYVAAHLDELEWRTKVVVAPFETLARLHDKERFVALARELGLRVPVTVMAASREELLEAIAGFDAYFARPSYSRGGVSLLTNTGPLAGALAPEDCTPTSANPWLVQPFVSGTDVCTMSVARHGRLTAHSAYVHAREIEHAGGIVFESVVDPESLRIAQRIVEAVDYHGMISLDFMRTDEGLSLVECNPRPTAGVFMLSPEELSSALFDEPGPVCVAAAGVRRKISVALVRDMVLHWREIPEDLPHLVSVAKDVYAQDGDLLPALYQLLSYGHVLDYKRHVPPEKRAKSDVISAYFHDVEWNGGAIR